ncbi:MAG: hypothetical protein FDZ69_13185 [Deltaproteobacteria bacterium]|nr:MAG: hypothetical protein FDZ69_13185 [Deltaproteobacteria bacterium]
MHELVSRALFTEQTKGIERVARLRGWTIYCIEYPAIDVGFIGESKDIRVRMLCCDWDEMPPSIELLSLAGERLSTIRTGPDSVFNNSAHPVTGYPFICMIGTREYHIHPSHTSDHWDNHKNKPGNDLGGILTQVWNAWLKIQG